LDKLLNGLERTSVAQEYVDEGREPPIVVHRPLGPGLIGVATARSAGVVSLLGAEILPRPPISKEPRGDPIDTV
jgi:hypothetical protein